MALVEEETELLSITNEDFSAAQSESASKIGATKGDRGRYYNIKYREVDRTKPRNFWPNVYASRESIQRLDLFGTLDAHRGCVNTVQFNATGDLLFSGSDDQRIIVWDWARKKKRLAYDSGHSGNVFQAKPMPFTDDSCVVSCAADGEVRVGYISEGSSDVETRRLANHHGRAHKLTVEPGSSNVFLSCGEDGIVRQFDLRDQSSSTKLFECREKNFRKRSIPLNALMIDPMHSEYLTVGASDEYVRVYDRRYIKQTFDQDPVLRYYAPRHLRGKNSGRAHITCVVYSYNGDEILATYNDEHIYLFDVNKDPIDENDEYVLLKKSDEEDEEDQSSDEDVDEDIDEDEGEDEEEEEEEGSEAENVEGSEVEEKKETKSKKNGEQKMEEESQESQDPNNVNNVKKRKGYRRKYEGHRNADTVKGVNFIGPRSEYVVSGSDCGHVFIWDKKTSQLVNLMKGDKRVVNCLEPHPTMPILATSGIDKNVKIWLPSAETKTMLKDADRVMAGNHRSRSSGSHRFNLTVPLIMRFLRHQQQRQAARAENEGAAAGSTLDEEDDDDDAVECTTS